jgi:hypothetical protein
MTSRSVIAISGSVAPPVKIVASESERLLIGAGQSVLICDPLGGQPDIDEIQHLLFCPGGMRQQVESHHRHARHAFRSAGDEGLARAHQQPAAI